MGGAALDRAGRPTDRPATGPVPAPPLPVFAHLPMLVNEQRKKLSKRRDPVAVESYRDQGYLPDAFVNYLSLLGWSPPGGEEIFDVGQMLEWFRLEDVNHSPAFFDVVKLTHINGEYIRAMPTEAFIEACRPWLTGDRAPWPDVDFDEAVFAAPGPAGPGAGGRPRRGARPWSTSCSSTTAHRRGGVGQGHRRRRPGRHHPVGGHRGLPGALADNWTSDALHAATLAVGEGVGRKLGKAQAPIRVAVTGRRVGPPLFEALEVLGPERTLDRLRAALDRAGASGP